MRRRDRQLIVLGLLGLALLGLNGCVGLAIGGGAVVANAAAQERGIGGAVKDTVIRAKINDRWLAHDADMFSALSTSVVEGRVLLTGNVKEPQARLDAVRIAWEVTGVKEVINEITVAKDGEGGSFGRDTWISTQLKTKMLFDRDIESVNYSVETVGGVIYLMGIAQNEEELRRVTGHARNLAYVRRVVSYVRLKDDPRRHDS